MTINIHLNRHIATINTLNTVLKEMNLLSRKDLKYIEATINNLNAYIDTFEDSCKLFTEYLKRE